MTTAPGSFLIAETKHFFLDVWISFESQTHFTYGNIRQLLNANVLFAQINVAERTLVKRPLAE